jgi:hypothetical protein
MSEFFGKARKEGKFHVNLQAHLRQSSFYLYFEGISLLAEFRVFTISTIGSDIGGRSLS